MPVLPGGPWGYRVITDAHGGQTLRHGMTVRRVPIPDEIVGCFIPGKGIGDLAGDPFGRWIGRHPEGYQPPPFMPEEGQNEEQSEADRRHNQEVYAGDSGRMLAHVRLPGTLPP